MGLRGALLLLAVSAALIVPAAASAATARVGPGISRDYPVYFEPDRFSDVAYYDADIGETNKLLVEFGLGPPYGYVIVIFHDPGAVIHVGKGCKSIDSHTARCDTGSNIQRAEAYLRDGDDEVHTTRPTPYPLGGVSAFGGPGDDLLDGGKGPDLLDGGGGRDTLLGGRSEDVLTDGDLSNRAGAAGPQSDVLDGGPDEDILSYRQRTRPIGVHLGGPLTAGEKGEDDKISGFESVVGGDAADRLDGDEHNNRLFGRRGRDLLIGRAGNDLLDGGSNSDRLHASDGDDELKPGSGIDRLSCGLGTDFVRGPVAGELIGRCETLIWRTRFYGDLSLLPHPTALSRRFASFRIGCPDTGDDEGDYEPQCAGALSLRQASGRRRVLGRARIDTRARPTHVFRIRLTKAGRRLLRRRNGVVANVSLRDGNFPPVSWTIRLRRGSRT